MSKLEAKQKQVNWDNQPPVYGMIPYFPGTWSVTFKPSGSCTSSTLSGYGDFPFDRFPDLPVIDLSNDERVDQWLSRSNWNESPADCLKSARKMGLVIHNDTDPTNL